MEFGGMEQKSDDHLKCTFCGFITTEAKRGNKMEIKCPNEDCGFVTALGMTGLLGLPHNTVLDDEIRRRVEKPLVLQSLDDFMHRTAMGQANRPSVQKQKGGDTDDMVAKSFAMGSGKKPMLDDDEEEEDTSYSSFMVRANETATKLAKEDEEKTSRDREIERDRERLELERELERKKEKDEEIARMREVAKQTQHSSPPSSSSSRLSPSTALSPLTRSQEQIVTNAVQLLELSKATSSKLEEGWEDIATHKVISLERNPWDDTAEGFAAQKYKQGVIMIEIIEGKDIGAYTDLNNGKQLTLNGGDDLAGCDPYVVIQQPSRGMWTEKTNWKPNTSAPLWLEYFRFEFDEVNYPLAPESVTLEVWNRNYVKDTFLGAVQIPLHTISTRFPLDRWWSLSPRAKSNEVVSGQIHLRLHYRKKYDPTSEASDEIRVINDILSEDAHLLVEDEMASASSAPKSVEQSNANTRIATTKKMMTAYEKRKEELLEKTLLLKPLTEMELTDTNDVSNIETIVSRIAQGDKTIERVMEDLDVHRRHRNAFSSNAECKKKWEEDRDLAELRLQYLLERRYYLESFLPAEKEDDINEE